jgi:uncharacterized protein
MTPDMSLWTAGFGGLLIGLAASGLLYCNGRIAGISGIAASLLRRPHASNHWAYLFLLGLLTGGLLLRLITPQAFPDTYNQAPLVLAVAGLLVGYGTRLGNGCTSGHGVCGLARRSLRSLIATLCFMATGMLTVYLTRLVA